MAEKDIKYINFSVEHVNLMQQISDLGLLGNKHDLMRVAILIGLKIAPSYELTTKEKNLLNRQKNEGVLNIHINQIDEDYYLSFMVNKFAPEPNGFVYRKMEALAFIGFQEIQSKKKKWLGKQSKKF